MADYKQLSVELGARSYPIYIGESLLSKVDPCDYVQGKRACIVTNQVVAPLYLETVRHWFQGVDIDVVVLPDGEQYKTLETLDTIFTHLLSAKHDRKTTLIALGGGVIGDMTGFAAACYQRGVPFIQIPTTVLAQVDSSVGGKTAVNHPLGKNMVGAFYQPQAVFIDTAFLTTLPAREFAAGIAEVIKYGIIRDRDFFDWLENNGELLKSRDAGVLATAIERSCLNKADVVAADETEQGLRALLNLGHTFGHAIETFQSYKDWLHGEAVAAGMVMAAQFSSQLGWLAQGDVERIINLLGSFGLPVKPPVEMTAADFLRLMAHDKKVLDGTLRLVLLRGLGSAVVASDFGLRELESYLHQVCES